MNLIPVAEFGALVKDKEYFVYDARDGFAVAKPHWFGNYKGPAHVDWELCVNSDSTFYLCYVTHVAELPPVPFPTNA